MKDLLLLDVDGVVLDLVGAFIRSVYAEYGVLIPRDQIVYHDTMGESPGLIQQEAELTRYFPNSVSSVGAAFEVFMGRQDVYESVDPIAGAIASIEILRENGIQFRFVTHVGRTGRRHFQSKMERLEGLFPDIPVITARSDDKMLVRGRWAVDDRYKTLLGWRSAGVEALLFGQPWNEAPADEPKFSWSTITGHILRYR